MTKLEASESPVLSVVIPTHNVEPWIGETLFSVLSQSLGSLEVLVVDDHSLDGTVDIVSSVAASDPRVVLIHADSRGGGSARNQGAQQARGRYIAFVDGDDIVPHGAYAALTASLELTRSQIAVGDYLKFSPTKTWRPTASMPAFSASVSGARLAEIPSLLYSRPCWNKVFDLAFWRDEQITFPDVVRSNDIVPMVTAYVRAEAIDMIDDVVYLYRDRPGATSMSSKTSSADAFVSYLTQELLCADLVGSLDDASLRSLYAALIYDRDGFFHARKFLSGWSEAGASDLEVSGLVSSLLAFCGPAPAWVDARKRIALALVAEGEFLAARAVAQNVDDGVWDDDLSDIRLRSWSELLRIVTEDPTRWAEVDSLIDHGAVRALQSVRVTSGAVEKEWLALASRLARRPGHSLRDNVPEAAALEDGIGRRRLLGGTVTVIYGGEQLRLRGHAQSDAAQPVLWSSEAGTVSPRRVAWLPGDGDMIWDADFRVGDLLRGQTMQPAFEFDDGGIVSALGIAPIPGYRRLENVLYEKDGAMIRIARRRHWILRAPRRLLITLRRRLTSLVARQPV